MTLSRTCTLAVWAIEISTEPATRSDSLTSPQFHRFRRWICVDVLTPLYGQNIRISTFEDGRRAVVHESAKNHDDHLDINPVNNETQETFSTLGRDDVVEAIGNADDLYQPWRRTLFENRPKLMLSVAERLRADLDVYAKLITLDSGKRISDSKDEIENCATMTEYYANGAKSFPADQPMDIDGADPYVSYGPLGVLMGVHPVVTI